MRILKSLSGVASAAAIIVATSAAIPWLETSPTITLTATQQEKHTNFTEISDQTFSKKLFGDINATSDLSININESNRKHLGEFNLSSHIYNRFYLNSRDQSLRSNLSEFYAKNDRYLSTFNVRTNNNKKPTVKNEYLDSEEKWQKLSRGKRDVSKKEAQLYSVWNRHFVKVGRNGAPRTTSSRDSVYSVIEVLLWCTLISSPVYPCPINHGGAASGGPHADQGYATRGLDPLNPYSAVLLYFKQTRRYLCMNRYGQLYTRHRNKFAEEGDLEECVFLHGFLLSNNDVYYSWKYPQHTSNTDQSRTNNKLARTQSTKEEISDDILIESSSSITDQMWNELGDLSSNSNTISNEISNYGDTLMNIQSDAVPLQRSSLDILTDFKFSAYNTDNSFAKQFNNTIKNFMQNDSTGIYTREVPDEKGIKITKLRPSRTQKPKRATKNERKSQGKRIANSENSISHPEHNRTAMHGVNPSEKRANEHSRDKNLMSHERKISDEPSDSSSQSHSTDPERSHHSKRRYSKKLKTKNQRTGNKKWSHAESNEGKRKPKRPGEFNVLNTDERCMERWFLGTSRVDRSLITVKTSPCRGITSGMLFIQRWRNRDSRVSERHPGPNPASVYLRERKRILDSSVPSSAATPPLASLSQNETKNYKNWQVIRRIFPVVNHRHGLSSSFYSKLSDKEKRKKYKKKLREFWEDVKAENKLGCANLLKNCHIKLPSMKIIWN